MSSAPFVYDNDGKVAWNKMWDSYCDLAIEGGPPHRNDRLISKGTSNNFNSENYKNAVKEIERAFSLLIPFKYKTANNGYIEIALGNHNIADWYANIINSENVECQVKENKIFLPINDDFTLEKEIKNIVTVVAKAFHYWSLHRNWFEKISIKYFGKDLKLLILSKKS